MIQNLQPSTLDGSCAVRCTACGVGPADGTGMHAFPSQYSSTGSATRKSGFFARTALFYFCRDDGFEERKDKREERLERGLLRMLEVMSPDDALDRNLYFLHVMEMCPAELCFWLFLRHPKEPAEGRSLLLSVGDCVCFSVKGATGMLLPRHVGSGELRHARFNRWVF